MGGYGVHRKLKFNASGKSISRPAICGHQLKVCGFRFDRIIDRSVPMRKNFRIKTMLPDVGFHVITALTDKIMADWESVASARSGIYYLTGERILDAYLLTIVCGYLPEGYTMDRFRLTDRRTRILRPFQHLFRLLDRLHLASIFFPLFFLYDIIVSIFTFAFFRLHQNSPELQMGMDGNRCMIRTYRGYIGLAVELVRIGDLIVLMEGGRVPLVLRSRDDDGWELVSDTYVHGIMSGEAWNGQQLEQVLIY